MLMPKKVKFRKQQRGRMAGKAWRGSTLAFGDFGLKVMQCGWITARQIEAARVAMTRSIKRGGKDYVVAETTDVKIVDKLDKKLFEKP